MKQNDFTNNTNRTRDSAIQNNDRGFHEGYRYKWKRVRLELNKLQRGRKQQKKEVKVPCAGKESLEVNFPLLQNLRRSETSGKYPKPPKGCPFPRFFNPPN